MAPNKQKQKQKELQAKKKAYQNRNNKSNSNKTTWIAIGVIAILVIVFAAVAASGIMGNNGANSPTASPTPSPIPASSDPYANATQVLLQTSMGDIIVELRNDMPITTTNFINCVNQGVYNGSTFHRVVEDFMIQGGEPANNQVVTPIQDERTTTNHNYNGTIAMAKTSQANSATSGFFINTADNSQITYPTGVKFDDTYSAFGRVIYGMDVAMTISHIPTNSETPVTTVSIIGAAVVA